MCQVAWSKHIQVPAGAANRKWFGMSRWSSSASNCPGRTFSMVKRGLVTFYNSELWTKQAAARDHRFGPPGALRAHIKPPY